MDARNWEFWLNMTNIALGVIAFAAVLVVAGAVAWELLSRRAQRVRNIRNADREIQAMFGANADTQFTPELGLTMADGGERLEPCKPRGSNPQERRG